MKLTRTQKILWAAAGVGTLVWIGLIVWTDYRMHDDAHVQRGEEEADVIELRFTLTAHTGESVTETAYRGKWLLIFFGFTNCPDVCPTTLGDLATVMDALGLQAEAVQPLFISIDPARDRENNLAQYVAAFHPTIVGLTGTDAEIDQTTRNLGVYYEQIDQETAPDGYTMSHTSAIYLISPEGEFVRVYTYGTTTDEIATDLRVRLES